MDIPELRAALLRHFKAQGFVEDTNQSAGLDLNFQRGDERWGLALCPDKTEDLAYLGAFEAAMQKIVDAKQRGEKKLRLGLGIAFASTAQGKSLSYRRALKKYSNSIVFEDLGLHLFFVTGDQAVDVLDPQEINPFLRDLDKWIAARRAVS